MRKLKLDLTELEVTSFEIQTGHGERGTVAAYKTLPPTQMTCVSCAESCGDNCTGGTGCEPTYPTCEGTCGSCAPTCAGQASCDAEVTCAAYLTCAWTCICA
jgi:hypothetical protein